PEAAAVSAAAESSHSIRSRSTRKPSPQALGLSARRAATSASPPTSVPLRALALGDSQSLHPAVADQPLGECRFPLRPAAPCPPRRETLKVRSLVAAANLTVDPPETDRLLEGLAVGEARRRGRGLLR